MEGIARIEAIEAIRQLKARYFRLIDTKAWAELPPLFTADLRIVSPDGSLWLEGGDAYAASLARGLADAVSAHQGFTSEIAITGENAATGVWAMQDVITWTDRHPREGWKAIVGQGHYHETYRREDGAWRIATLMLTRIRLDITWPEGQP